MDDRTLAVVLRDGRCGVPTPTPANCSGPCRPASDASRRRPRDGVLVVAGDEEVPRVSGSSGLRMRHPGPDARTGTPTCCIVDTGDHRAKVRVLDSSGAGRGGVIVAYEHSIASIDLVSGRLNWTFTTTTRPGDHGPGRRRDARAAGPDGRRRVPLSSGAAPRHAAGRSAHAPRGPAPHRGPPMTGKRAKRTGRSARSRGW